MQDGSRWWPSKERGWKRGFPERPWPLSNDAASLAFLLTASHMFNLVHDSLERQNLKPRAATATLATKNKISNWRRRRPTEEDRTGPDKAPAGLLTG
jgi:hypothetical protein